MDPQELLLVVFCLLDDPLKGLGLTHLRRRGRRHTTCVMASEVRLVRETHLRRRGRRHTTLSDSEVITIQIVGELWSITDHKALYQFFGRYYAGEFPALLRVHRTTFVRQAANLCWVYRRIQAHLAGLLAAGSLWLVDSLPLPVCRFARARTSGRFPGQLGWGFDPVAVKAFYGFRLRWRTSPDGVVLAYQLAPADAAKTEVIWDWVPWPLGIALGDRNYGSPQSQAEFETAGGRLIAPFKTQRYDPDRRGSGRLLRLRRRIEHTIGQLVERYNCRRIRVKDLWHLEHRLVRKILSHTVAIWVNVQEGHQPLQFERLVA